MKHFVFRKLLIFFLVFSVGTGICSAVTTVAASASETGITQPRKAKKAQKKADAKKKKQKEAIKDGSIEAQKRSYEIQTPEVKERMKQNKKDTAARDKAKRKSSKARTKSGAKKYK